VLFGISNYRNAIEFISSAIRKDKEVAAADVGKWRRDVSCDGIRMKLFIRYDPHLDLLLTHHRQQHRIEAFLQPHFADGLLFAINIIPESLGSLRVGDAVTVFD